jgi:DHA1 family bicyclomycin/chloramphenicol resistance-like MFS transporter
MPNATALAMADQGSAAGTASALLGLIQFGFAAVIPPLASLGGVSPLVMAVTTVATATLAVAVFVIGRPRSATVMPS